MERTSSGQNQSTDTPRERYATGSVTSRDGTTIGYRQLGHGPGVVVVHGSMSSAQVHMQLAEALAGAFTVYVPDRRGRGLSGPFGSDYSVRKEVEDLDALLTKTDAQIVFGVSTGAIVTLQAALTLSSIHRAAIYEPPLFLPPGDWMARYEEEIAQGKIAAGLVTAMKGTQMGPPIFNAMPRWLLERLTNMMMTGEDKQASGNDVTMRMLAPTLHYDGQLIFEMRGALESLRGVRADVLLLGGSKSPSYFRDGIDALETILPHVKRIELRGLGHAASWNANRGGKPELVAQELHRYFADT